MNNEYHKFQTMGQQVCNLKGETNIKMNVRYDITWPLPQPLTLAEQRILGWVIENTSQLNNILSNFVQLKNK